MTNSQQLFWSKMMHDGWNLYIAATNDGLCYIGSENREFEELETWVKKKFKNVYVIENAEALQPYIIELAEFFDGKRMTLDFPVDLQGTPFQQTVWAALQAIPYGGIVTYSDIAEQIGKPKSVRAVGTAIGANPVLIKVPCHRVIAKSGSLSGFRGGLGMKEKLIKLESKQIMNVQ